MPIEIGSGIEQSRSGPPLPKTPVHIVHALRRHWAVTTGQGQGATRARKHDCYYYYQQDKDKVQREQQGSTTTDATASRQWPGDRAKAGVTTARSLQAAGRQSRCSHVRRLYIYIHICIYIYIYVCELWKQCARPECVCVYTQSLYTWLMCLSGHGAFAVRHVGNSLVVSLSQPLEEYALGSDVRNALLSGRLNIRLPGRSMPARACSTNLQGRVARSPPRTA